MVAGVEGRLTMVAGVEGWLTVVAGVEGQMTVVAKLRWDDSSGRSCGEAGGRTRTVSQLFLFTFITGTLNHGETIPC